MPRACPVVRHARSYNDYLRWRTHQARPCSALPELDHGTVQALADPFHIHVLECRTDATDTVLLLGLRPEESVSVCASKLKGQVSKWLRESLNLEDPADLLSRGYFACTSGKSTSDAVESYLSSQGEHHGYTNRLQPPVYVQSFDIPPELRERLNPSHACSVLKFHIVLSTCYRRGVFVTESAKAVTSRWRELQGPERFGLMKASFVPDHVPAPMSAASAISQRPRLRAIWIAGNAKLQRS
jgi:REP element-mobilizing transposase RayT